MTLTVRLGARLATVGNSGILGRLRAEETNHDELSRLERSANKAESNEPKKALRASRVPRRRRPLLEAAKADRPGEPRNGIQSQSSGAMFCLDAARGDPGNSWLHRECSLGGQTALAQVASRESSSLALLLLVQVSQIDPSRPRTSLNLAT